VLVLYAISAKQSDCVVLVYQNMVVGTSYWVVPVVLLHIPTHETASNDQCTSAILIKTCRFCSSTITVRLWHVKVILRRVLPRPSNINAIQSVGQKLKDNSAPHKPEYSVIFFVVIENVPNDLSYDTMLHFLRGINLNRIKNRIDKLLTLDVKVPTVAALSRLIIPQITFLG
jgi:hypothetical protein